MVMMENKSILHFIAVDAIYYTVIELQNSILFQTLMNYGKILTFNNEIYTEIFTLLRGFYPNFAYPIHAIFAFSKDELGKMMTKTNILDFYDIVVHNGVGTMKYTLNNAHMIHLEIASSKMKLTKELENMTNSDDIDKFYNIKKENDMHGENIIVENEISYRYDVCNDLCDCDGGHICISI